MRRLIRHPHFGPAIVALVGTAAVLATIDGAGLWNSLPGPGVTCDETIYVEDAKIYVGAFTQLGLRRWNSIFQPLFDREWVQYVYHRTPDHPPLGRWLLGWAHWLTDPDPANFQSFSVIRARPAPAIAFGLLIFLIGAVTGHLAGSGAGTAAAAATLLMPRLFAHAHIAALDMLITLFYCAAHASTAWAMRRPQRRRRRAALAGFITGLALLTKVNALLLPVLIVPWALWFWGKRAVMPLLVWAAVAAATFILGWPWLWPWIWDSPATAVQHLFDYLARSTDRHTIHVWYFARRIPDRLIPGHYPWVLFLVTVPAGLHLMGLVGLRRLRGQICRDPTWALFSAGALVMMILFSIPGVVIYDGVRLFLMVLPLWAVFVGAGTMELFGWLRVRAASLHLPPWAAPVALLAFFALQAQGLLLFHPFQLSYYNCLIGGLRGAERLGLEATYWGDSVDRTLLAHVPAHTQLVYAPNLHPRHINGLNRSSSIYRRRDIDLTAELVAENPPRPHTPPRGHPRYLVVYNRRAYLDDVSPHLKGATRIAKRSRQGVWLSALYRLQE